jgi:hypothetical protein
MKPATPVTRYLIDFLDPVEELHRRRERGGWDQREPWTMLLGFSYGFRITIEAAVSLAPGS